MCIAVCCIFVNFLLYIFKGDVNGFFVIILYLCNRIRFFFLENFSELKIKKVA